MQKASLRKVKPPISYMQENNEEVLHFSLQGLLPRWRSIPRLARSLSSSVSRTDPIC